MLSIKIKTGCLNWLSLASQDAHQFHGNEAFMSCNHAFKNTCPPSFTVLCMQLLTLICGLNAKRLQFAGVIKAIL